MDERGIPGTNPKKEQATTMNRQTWPKITNRAETNDTTQIPTGVETNNTLRKN